MTALAADTGAELNYDTDYEILTNPQGCLIKRFEVISRILTPPFVVGGTRTGCRAQPYGTDSSGRCRC